MVKKGFRWNGTSENRALWDLNRTISDSCAIFYRKPRVILSAIEDLLNQLFIDLIFYFKCYKMKYLSWMRIVLHNIIQKDQKILNSVNTTVQNQSEVLII